MPDRLTEIEARDHYPGELRAFFERVRAAVGCEHMHDDCWMVAQKVERLLAKRRSAEAATPTLPKTTRCYCAGCVHDLSKPIVSKLLPVVGSAVVPTDGWTQRDTWLYCPACSKAHDAACAAEGE